MIRLVKVDKDGKMTFETFKRGDVPSYMILSHTWEVDSEQEVTYQDMLDDSGWKKPGYSKVYFCRDMVEKERRNSSPRFTHFWMDSICINRSSSAELTEAINSMFTWYESAYQCYVYLTDVSIGGVGGKAPVDQLYKSRWFRRGWTLQELLAPTRMSFYTREQKVLGGRKALAPIISEITNIPIAAIRDWRAYAVNPQAEEIMSWTTHRETTIEEDEAYCLLGLLKVSMPLIYGEGKEHAFLRLEEEVDKRAKRLQGPSSSRTNQSLRPNIRNFFGPDSVFGPDSDADADADADADLPDVDP